MDMLAGYGSSSASDSDSETDPPRLAPGVNSAPTQAAATSPGAGTAATIPWDAVSANEGNAPNRYAAFNAPSSTLPSATALFATGATLTNARHELKVCPFFVRYCTACIIGH